MHKPWGERSRSFQVDALANSLYPAALQDKLAAMAVANFFLWPMTRFLNDKFVPAEHRVVANHITTVSCLVLLQWCTARDECVLWVVCEGGGMTRIVSKTEPSFCYVQVVWNAWLSTLGHAPFPDPTDLFTMVGGAAAVQHAADVLTPAVNHAAEAVSPFVSHACQVRFSLGGKIDAPFIHDFPWENFLNVVLLVTRAYVHIAGCCRHGGAHAIMPPGEGLQQVSGHDLAIGLCGALAIAVLLDTAASLHLQRAGTLELVLDRLHSTHLS